MKKLWNYTDYVRHLGHPERLLRRWAFNALEEQFPNRYCDEVANLIGDEDSHLTCAALRYLAGHGAVQHAEKIMTCFLGGSGNVPGNCARALGILGYEPAAEQMLDYLFSADSAETSLGVLDYLGSIKRQECRETLRAAVVQIEDPLSLQPVIHNLLRHHHPEDAALVLDRYLAMGVEDHNSDSFLKTIAATLGGEGYFRDLTEFSHYSILERPAEVFDIFMSRNPGITLQKEKRESLLGALADRAIEDIVTMMMFDARGIIHRRYSDTPIPDWLVELFNQDSACLALLEALSKRSSVWKEVKNTEYGGGNLVALVLSLFFAVVEREAYVQALAPDASLEDLLCALLNTGEEFPEAIQKKIREMQPVAGLNDILTEELMTWGDIWTVRMMRKIGSAEFLPQLIRVLNISDSLDYISGDALRAVNALDASADEQILAAIRNRELDDWQSFSLLEHLPCSEAYDLAISLWHDEDNGMDSDEIFACCLEGIGDPRGVGTLRHMYNHENDALYIGESLACLAALHGIDLPELPRIDRQRQESEERRKARAKEFGDLSRNFHKKRGKGRSDSPGRVIPFTREEPKIGRNDPCPCGSGKKYKKCCLQKQ